MMLKSSSIRNKRYWPSIYNCSVPAKSEKLFSIQTNLDKVIIGAKIPTISMIVDNSNRNMMAMLIFGYLEARFDDILIRQIKPRLKLRDGY